MTNRIGCIVLSLLLIVGCSQEESAAVSAIAPHLSSNSLGIEPSDLRETGNPRGSGTFVYVPQTRFYGVERFILWLVIDGAPFPLNGATKNVTPNLPWLRDAPESVWGLTGLGQYNSASEGLGIVFPNR